MAGLRRRIDVRWPLTAAVGVLAPARPWSREVDLAGVGFALGAAAGWAGYILLTERVGARFTGLGGPAISMAAASAVPLPFTGAGHIVGHMGGAQRGPAGRGRRR
ncbi:hypothetical protein [Streptomyces sp. NPDC001652]|uniref:hypothetical protein n=1 Tax=Streptomyces sp. NPDC001652 TaxID=3154393 RepID=UPI003329BB65